MARIRHSILLLGTARTSDLQLLKQFVWKLFSKVQIESKPTIQAGLQWIAETNTFPACVILFENHPDEYRKSEIISLFTSTPFSHFLCLGSSWCESTIRSRRKWPETVWVSSSQAESWLAILHHRWKEEQSPRPLTASREETVQEMWCFSNALIASFPSELQSVMKSEARLMIVSSDKVWRSTWQTFLFHAGWKHVTSQTELGCATNRNISEEQNGQENPSCNHKLVYLLDGDPWTAEKGIAFQECLSECPHAAIFIFTEMLEPDIVLDWTTQGAAGVLYKLNAFGEFEVKLLSHWERKSEGISHQHH